MAATAELVDDLGALAPLGPAWDGLADACRRPCSAAAWMTAWARHVAPGLPLRVAVVRDGDEVIGILPFAITRTRSGARRLEILSAPVTVGVDLLARPGREQEVAHAAAEALAASSPRLDVIAFEGVPDRSPWPQLLAEQWPGARPGLLRREHGTPEPLVSLDAPDFDKWLAGKSSNFRQQIRRARRKLDSRAGVVRRTNDPSELAADLASFSRLHHQRWEGRGGTGVLTPEVDAMLADAGPDLLAAGQLDLWNVDVDAQTIGSQLWLQAGGTVTMWLSGSDDAYADVRPAVLIIAAVVQDAYERDLRPVSLGPGDQDYKKRFADAEGGVASWSLLLPGPRLPVTLGGVAARSLRREAVARLDDDRKARLRAVADRLRRG